MGMVWTMNGRVFEDMAVAPDEVFPANQPLAWEWINASPIPHPMHIHTIQFQVLGRDPSAVPAGYASVRDGFVDDGWHDTVLVWPGERVRVGMQFGPYTGRYMYHCHILEHEDMTMMRNFTIGAADMPDM
jgi:FtsP/CotA-like multicopper oxidase with cupredoxin domain